MKPSLRDIMGILETLAPRRIAEDWDNPGLQVGDPSQVVEKIFVALDPTFDSVVRASREGAQLLFTHHPLIFRPLTRVAGDTYPGNVIYECLRHGIAVFSAHTNLDFARGGINDMLAELFQLQDVEILDKRQDPFLGDIGLGRIGSFQGPMPLAEVIETAKELLKIDQVEVVGRGDREIRRTAVVGGAGGGMIETSSAKGADLLITGDVGHHAARDAEELGLAVIDAGHFHTEKAAFLRFADFLPDVLRQKGWDVTMEHDPMERCPSWYG